MFYLVILVLSFIILWYLYIINLHCPEAPPGPTPWPILGNLVQMGKASEKNVCLMFWEMSKSYGEIFSLKIGSNPAVILTSKEAVEMVMSNDAAIGRDRVGSWKDRSFGKNIGLALSDGEFWERTKVWTFKLLREFGFGKTSQMEHYVQDAAEDLFQIIDEKIEGDKATIEMDLFFSPLFLKVMWRMMVGRITPEDEFDIKHLCEKGEGFIRSSIFGAGLINAFPSLRYLFPKAMGHTAKIEFFNACNDVAKKLLLETSARHRNGNLKGPPANLVEAFAQNLDKEDIFSVENFQLIFQDLLVGSTETTNSYLECIIMYLILFPDMQENIFNEVSAIAPNRKFVSYADRKRMPYTEAFLLEVHRCCPIVPNFMPHRATEDFKYKNYLIRKDTLILPDLYSLYKDPNAWEEPEHFNPERFLNENGEIFGANRVMSFGCGKRACPGELNANVISFIFLTSIVHRYKIRVPKDNPKPSRELQPGMACRPQPFEACFITRE